MKTYVDGTDLSESTHPTKKILIDTTILCYAHDRARAARLTRLYEECVDIKTLLPTEETHREALNTAEDQQATGGDIFDRILAHTAKGKVDTIWTDNTKRFTSYLFLKTENPLKWD